MTFVLPFATLQDSTNRAVIAALANATVTIAGQSSPAVFDDAYSAGEMGGGAMGGMANTQPTLMIDSSLLPQDYDGQEILVNDEPYLIAAAQPDGMGLSRIMLEKVQ